MQTDRELLERYARQRDQAAFAEMAGRHVDLVYGAARRMLHGPGRGEEDVVQAVFLLLAQKAGRIPGHVTLAGWLFRATRYCCANLRKEEGRRKRREREAGMQEHQTAADDLSSVLDEALDSLGRAEREAILARFMERQSAAEAGAALGISAAAAEKRVQRGLLKLRVIFARKGFVVPAAGIGAVMAVESAKAAPGGMALSAAEVTRHAGVTAIELAKGAAMMMKLAALKTVAAIVLVVIVLAGGAGIVVDKMGMATLAMPPAPLAAIPAAPVLPQLSPIGVQRPMLARWEVIVDAPGMERLKKELTAVPSASKGYQAYDADADKLQLAMKDAFAAKEILLMPQQMGWSDIDDHMRVQTAGRFDFSLFTHHATGVFDIHPLEGKPISVLVNAGGMAANMAHSIFVDAGKNAVHLKIASGISKTDVLSQGKNLGPNLELQFEGDVSVGRSRVFAAKLSEIAGVEIWHVSIWQAFASGDQEWQFLRNTSPGEWIQIGLPGIKQMADRAILWGTHAAHPLEEVKPQWEKKLPNGGVLRLLAVSRPSRWRYCWWDAAGQAVGVESGRGLMIQETPPSEAETAVIVESRDESVPAPVWPLGETPDQRTSMGRSAPRADGVVEVGVGAGAWQDAGPIIIGKEITVQGARVKLTEISQGSPKQPNFPGTSFLHIEETGKPDVEIQIAAFDKKGKEIRQDYAPRICFDHKESAFEDIRQDMIYALPADVAACHIRWRVRSWTSFTGFAKVPVVSPDEILATPAATQATP